MRQGHNLKTKGGNPGQQGPNCSSAVRSKAPETDRKPVQGNLLRPFVRAAQGPLSSMERAARIDQPALRRIHDRKGRRQAQATRPNRPSHQHLLNAARNWLIDTRNRTLLTIVHDAMLSAPSRPTCKCPIYLRKYRVKRAKWWATAKADGERNGRDRSPRTQHWSAGVCVARSQRHHGRPAASLGRYG